MYQWINDIPIPTNCCNFVHCHLLKFILGLFKLQELVKTPSTAKTEMYIRQAGPESYRQVLKEVRQKEIYKLIVDTNPKHIHRFFRAVRKEIYCSSFDTTEVKMYKLLLQKSVAFY